MKILGASICDCVHILGVYRFLQSASEAGHTTRFLGPAVSIDQLIEAIKAESPDAVAVSYRLTPENAEHALGELRWKTEEAGLEKVDYLFGGTEPVAEIAESSGFFRIVCDGNNIEEVEDYLTENKRSEILKAIPSQDVRERVRDSCPWPILRTHFGLPDIDHTTKGIERIADSGLIDVISLGTDQDAQSNFFHPERQSIGSRGAGGVPVRSGKDFKALYGATRSGNFPLMRTYAGTDDLIKLAELYEECFGNAWSAVPLFWFNQMDGRGPHELERSIKDHLELIRWNAERDMPVEILEAHHWAMRWAHDSLVVASARLGAEVAKGCGVKDYIHQYMFNVSGESAFCNELAKMLATKELVSELAGDGFRVFTQTRTGLPSFPNDLEEARAQLANSTMLQMQLDPDIIHVVSYSEPHHAATADDVINSAKIVRQTIRNSMHSPKMYHDRLVEYRKHEIMLEAETLLRMIRENGDILDPKYLCSLVETGVLDAPMLKNNRFARGEVSTIFLDGTCKAVDSFGRVMREEERLRGYHKDFSYVGGK